MNYLEVKKEIEKARNLPQLEKKVEEQLKKEHEKEIKLTNRKLPYEATTEEEIKDKLVHRKVITAIQYDAGQRLREIREKQNLTQPQIIDLYNKETGFNISDTCLTRWESGARAIDLIFLVWFAEKYNVNLHWLLIGEEWDKNVKELQNILESAIKISKKL